MRTHTADSGNCAHCVPLITELGATLRVDVFTSRAPLSRDDLMATTTRTRTPTVLPEWQHLHSQVTAQGCAAIAHLPSNLRACCRMAGSLVAQRASSVASRSRDRVACRSRERVACRRRHAGRRRARHTLLYDLISFASLTS